MSMIETTILNKLRKHLELYNIQEKHQVPSAQKCFTINPLHQNQATIFVKPSLTILDDAWIIKIIDTFLSESLLIDAYNLKINYPEQKRKELKEALSVLSVSFIEQPQLQTNFQFSIRTHGQNYCLAHGGRQEHREDFLAQINIDKILIIEPKISLPTSPALSVIIPLSQAQNPLGLLIASALNRKGVCIDILLQSTTPAQEKLEQAQKMCAKYVLLLGPDEQKNGTITIRNLQSGSVETVKQAKFIEL